MRRKLDKDYDGDGKVEPGKEEYFGSKDKAIKKAMGKEVKEGNEGIQYPKGPSRSLLRIRVILRCSQQRLLRRWA